MTDRRAGRDKVMLAYEFGVDETIPDKIAMPLAQQESLIFDFNAVYQHTFTVGRWGIHIDYDKLPRALETYAETDQARIQQLMARL